MQAGQIVLRWNSLGELDVKCSLSLCSAENKKLAIHVLLDAAKAVNDSATALEDMERRAAPVRLLGGSN